MARKKQRSTYLLNEPNWKELSLITDPDQRKKAISNAEYFVHYEIATKKKQEALIKWVKQESGWTKEEIKYATCIDKGYFSAMGKTAWVAKKLGYWPDGTLEYINEKQKPQWLALGKKVYVEKVEEKEKKNDTKVISIQDRMKEQVSPLCGTWEEQLDNFVDSEAFDLKVFDPYNDMRAYQPAIKPAHAKIIKDSYDRDLLEAKQLLAWEDPDLKEAYSHFNLKMRKEFYAFFEKIQTACDTLIETGKATRKPRKPKPMDRDKLVKKLKYQINDSDLGIASINPVEIIDATELWFYNTKLRKLGVYRKSEMGTGLTIKGTTIKDFDTSTSFQKTLRKPAEQIKELMKGGKPNNRKQFAGIKATEIKYNGRGNEHVVILKAW